MKTDQQLQQEVEAELSWDQAVKSTDIGVEVKDRVVTLSGHPASYAENLAAEKATRRVTGVKAVVVEMAVRVPHSEVRNDEDIANAVRSLLHWTVGLHEEAVKVQVEKGWVTLRGEVDSAYQSHLANRTIAHMHSVTGVTNLIDVRGEEMAKNVGEQIAQALQRHVAREAKHIDIRAHDRTVTLAGRVDSYAERSLILGVAWSAPGVNVVIDDLVVGRP